MFQTLYNMYREHSDGHTDTVSALGPVYSKCPLWSVTGVGVLSPDEFSEHTHKSHRRKPSNSNLPTHLRIQPFIPSSIHCIHSSSTHPPIHLHIHPFNYPPTQSSIHASIHPSPFHLLTQPFSHPPIHLPIHHSLLPYSVSLDSHLLHGANTWRRQGRLKPSVWPPSSITSSKLLSLSVPWLFFFLFSPVNRGGSSTDM